MAGYSVKMDANRQITMEERIAQFLFHDGIDVENGQGEGPREEFCGELSKKILLMVLTEFRPDLID